MSPFDLSGKHILITGASSGIGKSTAIICSQLGGILSIVGRNRQRLEDTMSQLRGEGHQMFICDLSEEIQVANLVDSIQKLDGIVYCAGTILTEEGKTGLCLTMKDEPTACGCQAFTGNYYQREVHVSAVADILEGNSAMLLLRGQGTRRYYALGISGGNRAAIVRYDRGKAEELAAVPLVWETDAGRSAEEGRTGILLEASAVGPQLSLSVNGIEILETEDDRFSYGMTGLGMSEPGRILVSDLHISGNCDGEDSPPDP